MTEVRWRIYFRPDDGYSPIESSITAGSLPMTGAQLRRWWYSCWPEHCEFGYTVRPA